MHRQKSPLFRLLLLFPVFITGFVVRAEANGWSVYASSSGRFLLSEGFSGPLTYFVQPGEKFYGYVSGMLSFEVKNLGIELNVSSWEISQDTIDDGTLGDRLTQRGFVDEVYAFYRGQTLHLQAGWQHLSLMDGYITDDYWPGITATVSFDAGDSVRLSPFAGFYKVEPDTFLTSRKSFYAGGGIDGEVKPAGLSFRLGFQSFIDRADSMKNFLNETYYSFLVIAKNTVLRSLEEEFIRRGITQTFAKTLAENLYYNLLSSERFSKASANIYWIWSRIAWEKGPWKINMLAGWDLGSGNADMLVPDRNDPSSLTTEAKSLRFSGYLFKPSFFWGGLYFMETEISLLWMSGDPEYVRGVLLRDAGSAEIGAFFSFRPLIYDSAIFFQQGINQGLHTSGLIAAGIMGTGFIVPQLNLRFYPRNNLYFELKNIFIMAEKTPRYVASSFIGYELDFLGIWDITHFVSLQAEFDYFVPGSFSPDSKSGFTFTAGIDLHVDEKGAF